MKILEIDSYNETPLYQDQSTISDSSDSFEFEIDGLLNDQKIFAVLGQ
jgi:hypothetical protein